jgi:LysM repeat protein
MNLNDFFSKPTRIKEAYANNYPSYTPPAAAADVSSDSDSADEPKFNRFSKTGGEPEFDFRKGLVGDDETDYETENEPELGTFRMGKPVEPNDAATNAFMAAFQGAGEQNADNSLPLDAGEFRTNDGRIWRFVTDPAAVPAKKEPQWIPSSAADSIASWKANNPGKSAADWGSVAADPKPAPPALDLTPKSKYKLNLPSGQVPVDVTGANANSIKSGSNPNIDAKTRANALAWAASKNAVAAVKPVAATPAATLRDLPQEKPGSVKDIARANNISNPDRIMPGQVLKIPGRADYVVQPGDTLSKIAAGQTKPPKYTPSDRDTQPAATAVLKKYPELGIYAPLPRDVQNNLNMGGTRKEIAQQGREQLLTPAMIKRQKEADLVRTPADVERVLAANLKANAARIAARDAEIKAREAAASRKKVKEDNIDEQTVPNEFKWGAPSWTARDGTVLAYDKKTNAYNMSSGPTKPDPKTMMSAIQTQRTTTKTGQPDQMSFDRTTIAVNPANPNDNRYMDQSSTTTDGKEENSTRRATNVTPKWMDNLKYDAGITTDLAPQPPSQYPTQVGQGENNRPFAAYSTPPGQLEVNRESLDRMQSLAGIPSKADDIDEGTFDDQTQVSSIERDSTSDIDGKADQSFSSTSFQQDPANPGNNSYLDRQENNGVATTTYAQNVTPKWMSNLKATAGLPGAKPAPQPPSQYPTQVGQGENNRPFAAYSTPPGQLEVNRESLDRMRSLAGIRKK